MIDFTLIVIPFILGLILIGRVMSLCEKKGMVNAVGSRSSHKKPTVRGGGLVFALVLIPFSLFYLANLEAASLSVSNENFLWALTLSSAVIAFLGWRDDIKNVPAYLRFALQAVCVGGCVYFLPALLPELLPLAAEKVILTLAWMWFLNLYNFMDGIDGFASCEAIFLAIILSFLCADIKPMMLVLAGTALGVLRLNFSPAKIFLGDVGSTFLGFVLGGCFIYTLSIKGMGSFFPLLTLTLLFTADATFTLIKRTLQGHKPWVAHREHFYQRAYHNVGFSHTEIVARGMLLNIGLLILSIIGFITGNGVIIFVLALLLLAAAAFKIRTLEGK